MKRISTAFLQSVAVFIGIIVLAILILAPLTEGRATNLDLISIYADPFILYGYAVSIVFFVALYKVFQLLGYIGRNELFSPKAIKALKTIKYCAFTLSFCIVAAGLYILIFHSKEDDAAGFIAICILTTFASLVVATAAAIFEKKLKKQL